MASGRTLLSMEAIKTSSCISLGTSAHTMLATHGVVSRTWILNPLSRESCETQSRCKIWRSQIRRVRTVPLKCKAVGNGAKSWNSVHGSSEVGVEKYRSRLESLLYSGKEIPEEEIETPTGVPKEALAIGNMPRCSICEAKGAVECVTCTGSGLYVDSILESQGIIVKVKCLGCGGTGSIMCPTCGGRGHTGGCINEERMD